VKTTLGQLFRYGIVGVLSNAVGYLLYLGITMAGMEHKLAMTLLYLVGVAQTFLFNRQWTFRSEGPARSALIRYVLAHMIGYVINFLMLSVLVDRFGFPHQWVQAAAIFIVAGFLFVAMKFLVFRKTAHG
jgi:putative flippase GtrA